MYENGQYVEENINKAVHWYQMASQKNCPKAQLALGKIYYYGMSPNHISSLSNIDKNNRNYQRVEKNFYEAINLFQKSAEQVIFFNKYTTYLYTMFLIEIIK